MDRIRPDTLAEIKKKERAYPHEIRAMVQELEHFRMDKPFEEPVQGFVPKLGMQAYHDMIVCAMSYMDYVSGPYTMDTMKALKRNECKHVQTATGLGFLVWRIR